MIPLLLSVEAPGGLWSNLINWIHSGIGNFGWTILLLTVLIKLVISPLDFWTKLSTKKQTLIQQKCAPQVAKIEKKFGANKEQARIQTNALYKREGLNAGAGCLIMAANLILTLAIFFSFFSAFRSNSAYQAINQYEILIDTYNTSATDYLISRNSDIEDYDIVDADSAGLFFGDLTHGKDYFENPENYENVKSENPENNPSPTEEEAPAEGETPDVSETPDEGAGSDTETPPLTREEMDRCIAMYFKYKDIYNETILVGEKSVVTKWKNIKSSWLWIDNIWVSDAPVYPFLSYGKFVSTANSGGKKYKNYVKENVQEGEFNIISDIVNKEGGRRYNGFLILAALAALATFLAQYISELHNKLKNKKANEAASLSGSMDMSMKFMKFIMPIIMVVFVLQSSASFGIYILASNISSIAFGEVSNLIISKITYKKQKEVEEVLEKEANRLIKKGKLQEKK